MHKIGCGSFNAKKGAENENAFLWVSISNQTDYISTQEAHPENMLFILNHLRPFS